MIARKPPGWFYIVGVVLLLWGLMGCFACVQQFRLGADAMGPASAYDRALHASLPIWYNALFAVSVGTPTLGAAMLLARSILAWPLAIIALVGVVIMFGWMFTMTDIIAVKGFVAAAGFPILIAVIAIFQIWFTALARKRIS